PPPCSPLFPYTTLFRSLSDAAAADRALAAGSAGALTGVPIAHKDIFCTQGVRTTCGSRMLDNFVSPYDATVVAKLKGAGAVMLRSEEHTSELQSLAYLV